jgi:hypothetical protein
VSAGIMAPKTQGPKMQAEIDPLSRVLGSIEAQLATITKTQSEDRVANAAWRTDVRREIGGIREDITEIKGSANSATIEINEIKPIVADYVEQRAQARGMGRIAHAVSGLFGAGFLFALQKLWAKFGG